MRNASKNMVKESMKIGREDVLKRIEHPKIACTLFDLGMVQNS